MDINKEVANLYPWLYRIAKKYCSSIYDIEDLVGETIYKILSNKDKFDESRSLKPWCEVIMLNTYITNYNRRTLVSFIHYDGMKEMFSYNLASDNILIRDIIEAIKRCYSKSCCMDCVIYYAKGYSYDEISKILDIPISTVRSRISSGRELLKKELGLSVK